MLTKNVHEMLPAVRCVRYSEANNRNCSI